MDTQRHKMDFLPEFNWAVPLPHKDFLDAGYFDNGSVFHAHRHMYEFPWHPEGHSVLVHSSHGTRAASRRLDNLESKAHVSIFEWPSKLERRLVCSNEALLHLLQDGNVLKFLKIAKPESDHV